MKGIFILFIGIIVSACSTYTIIRFDSKCGFSVGDVVFVDGSKTPVVIQYLNYDCEFVGSFSFPSGVHTVKTFNIMQVDSIIPYSLARNELWYQRPVKHIPVKIK